MERLKHLGRIARSAPPFLKALIQLTAGHDDSWAANARRDLHVLWEFHRATAGSTAIAKMRDPTAAPIEWLQLMTERPETWKQAVGRLSRQAYAPKERPAVAAVLVDEGVCLDCHQCFPAWQRCIATESACMGIEIRSDLKLVVRSVLVA